MPLLDKFPGGAYGPGRRRTDPNTKNAAWVKLIRTEHITKWTELLRRLSKFVTDRRLKEKVVKTESKNV